MHIRTRQRERKGSYLSETWMAATRSKDLWKRWPRCPTLQGFCFEWKNGTGLDPGNVLVISALSLKRDLIWKRSSHLSLIAPRVSLMQREM